MEIRKLQQDKPRILAIIPARGKETRIINRNIRDFYGKPIIAYSIEAALNSCIFDEVMVSTEDENIAQLAKQCGAQVPFLRSSDSVTDNVSTDTIVLEVIEKYEKMGITFDWVCCIYPIAPFVTSKKLLNAYRILKNSAAYSLIAVVRTNAHPLRCMTIDQSYIRYMWPEYSEKNSADLEQAYEDAGQFYFSQILPMKECKSMMTSKTLPYYLSSMEVQGIHSLDEWKMAEFKYEIYKSMYLREASLDDMWKLFDWRNDEETTNKLFQSNSVTFDDYKNWFINVLGDKNMHMYILMKGGMAIGQARVCYANHQANISYSIDKRYRGNGYGKMLLRLVEDEIVEKIGSIHIVTEVSKNDVVSRRIFNSLGYRGQEKDDVYQFTKNASFSGQEPLELYSAFNAELAGGIENSELINKNHLDSTGGILFLTNNQNTIDLYNWIIDQQIPCILLDSKISIGTVKKYKPKLIVSYNYSHIIEKDVIDYMKGRIINLHISLLPWNRGASPNLWSFIDNTPKGVTIHEVNEGLDKGDIIFQKEYFFDEKKETFASTYKELNNGIQTLFKKHFYELYNGKYTSYSQKGKGSYHSIKDMKDLYSGGFDWDENIETVLKRIKGYGT